MKIERELPHDQLAERSLIGSVLVDPETIYELIEERITKEDFFVPKFGIVFDVLMELNAANKGIDFVTLSSKLKELGLLEKIGGQVGLSEIFEEQASSVFIRDYAKIVKTNSMARKIIQAGKSLQLIGYEYTENPEGFLSEAEKLFVTISQEVSPQTFVTMKSALTNLIRDISKGSRKPGEIMGLSTGYKELDKYLMGLQPGQMFVLAARPSVGKTTFALNICQNVAKLHKLPVIIFSLEMSSHEVTSKILASETGIPLHVIKMKNFNAEHMQKLNRVNELSEIPFYIDDRGGQTIMEMRSKARRLKMERGLGLIMIDYLQIIRPHSKHQNKADLIGDISMAIKALAKELEVPIMVLAQLNREFEKDSGGAVGKDGRPKMARKPRLSDLRDSGAIEADADIVIFIDREKDLQKNPDQLTTMVIGKNRSGELGDVYFRFDGALSSFVDVPAPPWAQRG